MMKKYVYQILYESELNHWWHASRRKMVLDWIEQRYPSRSNLAILDAGCGTGLMMKEMSHLGNINGVDLSDEALRFCAYRGIDLVNKANVAELPYRENTFDIVTGLDIVEHIEGDVEALHEWKRVLKTGGRIFIFVPAYTWLWSLQDDISGHQRRYTARTLKQTVSEAGFRLERLSYCNTYLFPIVVVGRQWLKLLQRFKEVQSENNLHPYWSNGILSAIFRAEIPVLRYINFPIGCSILCVAVKD